MTYAAPTFVPSGRTLLNVFVTYSHEDAALYHELLSYMGNILGAGLFHLLEPLVGQPDTAKIENWNPSDVQWRAAAEETLERADVLLLLLSADYLAADAYQEAEDFIIRRQQEHRVTILPVYLRSCNLSDARVADYNPVPGMPVTAHDDRSAAYNQVKQALLSAIPIGKIFKTMGQPDLSFIEPAQLPELIEHLSSMGRGLVIEGPSGIGKTTATRRALERALSLVRHIPTVTWLDPKKHQTEERILEILHNDFKVGGHLIIDDFHRLDYALQRGVANLIKIISDDDRNDAKVTLIGISPIGASLLKGAHDLAGRFSTVYIGRQPDEKIDALIAKGEAIANVAFPDRSMIVNEAAGSFYVAQALCYEACLQQGVRTVQAESRQLDAVHPASIIARLHGQLSQKYHESLCALASLDTRPPPRGAALSLLWLLHESTNKSVSVSSASYAYPALAEAFEWLMEGHLSRRIHEHQDLRSWFYYRDEAAILSIDDPQLDFFLRHLNWRDFIRQTGHISATWDPAAGPIFQPFARADDATVSNTRTPTQH